MMITVICNIFVNSTEKLHLFHETFPLVYKISDNWLIYIRGKYRLEVLKYIKSFKNSKKNCIFFEKLYNNDWAKSSSKMLFKSKYDYIYVFLEDHFLQKPIKHFQNIIQDAINNKVDYFTYSFFNIGLSVNSIEHLYPDETKFFQTINLNSNNISILQKTNKSFYPFSLAAICSKKYFNQLLNIEDKILIQIHIIIQALMENIFFFYPKNRNFWYNINEIAKYVGIRFVIYPPTTPFNLEKSLFDCDKEILPLKVGVLKEELFVNWDDDNKLSNSSLIKRGLYPLKLKINCKIKPKLLEIPYSIMNKDKTKVYQFCPDVPRTRKTPTKFIFIKNGKLKVSANNEIFILKTGQFIWINANVPHLITAIEDSSFQQYYEY